MNEVAPNNKTAEGAPTSGSHQYSGAGRKTSRGKTDRRFSDSAPCWNADRAGDGARTKGQTGRRLWLVRWYCCPAGRREYSGYE